MIDDASFSEFQAGELARRGISVEVAKAAGVLAIEDESNLPEGTPDYWTRSNGYLPGLLYPWKSPNGETEWQLKPDVPVFSTDGTKLKKYVFGPGAASILNVPFEVPADPAHVLITEGTNQTIAAGHYAPKDVAVYGIAGCQSWMKDGVPSRDLYVVEGKSVLVVLDADASSNRNVFDAGVALREALLAEGATEVRFVRVPGGQKSGLDDVLGARDEIRRPTYLASLISATKALPKGEKPGQPSKTKPPKKANDADHPDHDPDALFEADGKLRVATLSRRVLDERPAALTREHKIAMYLRGCYRVDGTAFISGVASLLGERYSKASRGNAEEFTIGVLAEDGALLPERMDEPLLNCLNGMVDLATGELFEHDPGYFSISQIPIEYDPAATCPTYDAWVLSVIPDQVEDLEESISMMLDPSQTPTKAAFLFGPSRSGKGTFLRLMMAIAGAENTSAVSLHQLSGNKFAAAMVYGKMLNASGDLSAAHVDDLSIFKMMTGEDPVMADRKFGQTFNFTNRALFAFGANDPPTVSETSGAYIERIRPFKFGASFAGHENPEIERAMLTELPGILNRWIAAWQRRAARGAYLTVDKAVMDEFEEASDKVRRWFGKRADVIEVSGTGSVVGGRTVTDLYRDFIKWTVDEGLTGLGKNKFEARLERFAGVLTTCRNEKRVRCTNVRIVEGDNGQSGRSVGQSGQTEGICTVLREVNISDGGVKNDSALSIQRNGPSLPGLPADDGASLFEDTL